MRERTGRWCEGVRREVWAGWGGEAEVRNEGEKRHYRAFKSSVFGTRNERSTQNGECASASASVNMLVVCVEEERGG